MTTPPAPLPFDVARSLADVRTALVHEWLVDYAGSERVLAELLGLWPDSDLYALVDFMDDATRAHFRHKSVGTSFVQGLPGARRHFRQYLPLFPMAVEQFDLRPYQVVISSSHAVAKGVLTHAGQLHICYCHSPMRYAWDLYAQYMQETGLDRGAKGWAARWLLHRLRTWDYLSANRPDHFVANSHYIARRIRKVYNRTATVIYPPVAVDDFTLEEQKEDYYLVAARMVPYKKVNLVVEAFGQLPDRKLVVVGDGSEAAKIRAMATRNVTLLPPQPFAELRRLMQRARAFVFAAEEDFGITLVEAQACGTPVIAFGQGGAAETVRHGQTGWLFGPQTPAALVAAVQDFERHTLWPPDQIRRHAETFGVRRFQTEMMTFVRDQWAAFEAARTGSTFT